MGSDPMHFLTKSSASNNQPLVYYSGSAWDKANEVVNARQWFDYLSNFKTKLTQPVKVVVQ